MSIKSIVCGSNAYDAMNTKQADSLIEQGINIEEDLDLAPDTVQFEDEKGIIVKTIKVPV